MRKKKEKKHLISVLVDDLLLQQIENRRRELGHHRAGYLRFLAEQDIRRAIATKEECRAVV